MKRFGQMLVCLCIAALAVGLMPAGMASSETVYQMAVNDRFLDMTAGTMPFRSEGVPYVPSIIFDQSVTGVRLGISSFVTSSDTEYTLTVYGIGATLRFDLLRGTCTEQGSGESLNMRAISRNGTVFVPVGGVCSYFGLRSSLTPTSYGTLLRITNGQETYDTNKFIEVATATGRLQDRYNEYTKAQAGVTATAVPSQAPAITATPVPSGGGPDKQGVPLYLAFRCTDGAGLEGILDTLARSGICGLFLFRPEDLAQRESQVRQVVGSGHAVGLLVPGGSLEEALSALEAGGQYLARNLRLRTHTAAAEGAAAEVREALSQAGWACWVGNVNGLPDGRSPVGRGSVILEAAQARRGAVRITLDDGSAVPAVLSRILPHLLQEGYDIRPAVETEL